jgi:hypothetical protein
MHHRTIQIDHQPDAYIFQFIILTFNYSSTCFWRFPAHHQKLNDCRSSLWFYLRIVVIVVLCSWSGRPVDPTTNTARRLVRITKYQISLKLIRQFLEFKHVKSVWTDRCFISRLQFMYLTSIEQKHQ